MNTVAANRSRSAPLILCISLALRWALILRGGQYYFSDEGRYETSRAFVDFLLSGDSSSAFAELFTAPEHLGFKLLGVIPAFFEHVTRESLVLPTLFFSVFSVLNLFLIYKISQQTGATQQQSFFALVFAASSMSLLYFSRHLVPYDPAMTFGLLAILIAVSKTPSRATSLLCGASAFLCFITYNGYWALAGLGMLVNILQNKRNGSGLIRRAWLTAAGFALPAILLFLLAALAGTNLLAEYGSFSSTVSQGSFEEGWSLPFEYFWHAEHGAFILLILLAGYAIVKGVVEQKPDVTLWLTCLIAIYLCLAIPATALQAFVVYGRLARQMMPFFILLAAGGLAQLKQDFSFGDKLTKGVLVALVIQAAWNYQKPFSLTYPRDFAEKAQAMYPDFHFSEKRLIFGAPTLCQNNGYIAEYIKRFEVPPGPDPAIEGEVLLSALHPDNFLPYQYEGYTPQERTTLRDMQIEMRLYRAAESFMNDANPVWKIMRSCVVREE